MMKMTMMILLMMSCAFASQFKNELEKERFLLKQKLDEQAYELKSIQEKELMTLYLNTEKISGLLAFKQKNNMNCIEWVYRGSASRAEATQACRGVRDMKCVEWVYRGSATRVEAANACRSITSNECYEWVYRGSATRVEATRACRGVRLQECVEWVYRGSATREESATACRGVREMDCVEWVYRGSASRVESAQSCGINGRDPRGPRC